MAKPRRAVWVADLLPNEIAPAIGAMIDQGLAAMKKTLERAAQATGLVALWDGEPKRTSIDHDTVHDG